MGEDRDLPGPVMCHLHFIVSEFDLKPLIWLCLYVDWEIHIIFVDFFILVWLADLAEGHCLVALECCLTAHGI